MFRINLRKIVKIILAFRINAFMHTEKGSVFFRNMTVTAVRTEKTQRSGCVFAGRECLTTDLALVLSIVSVVVVYVVVRSTTDRTADIFRNCAAVSLLNRL